MDDITALVKGRKNKWRKWQKKGDEKEEGVQSLRMATKEKKHDDCVLWFLGK